MRLPAGFDLHALEVFLLTVELGGMTQSANLLGQTQSAVSQTIAKLESALGATLFDRSLRPLALTREGKALFEHGSRLLVSAKGLVSELRDGARLPVQSITIAMAESMANQLTAPLLTQLGDRAAYWRIISAISQTQHEEFLLRKFDMLITGNSTFEDVPGLQHLPILHEGFILLLPRTYTGPVNPIEAVQDMPFIRYSLQSGMGQRIERQAARMRLRLSNFVEVDSTFQQLTTVAAGLGWSITSPLCVLPHLTMLDQLRLEPMPRAQFFRQFQLVARDEDLGHLAGDVAALARRTLRDVAFAPLVSRYHWIEQMIEFPEH